MTCPVEYPRANLQSADRARIVMRQHTRRMVASAVSLPLFSQFIAGGPKRVAHLGLPERVCDRRTRSRPCIPRLFDQIGKQSRLHLLLDGAAAASNWIKPFASL